MDTNLTTMSRDAVTAATRHALAHGNPSVEPSHLLHALFTIPDNTVSPLVAGWGLILSRSTPSLPQRCAPFRQVPAPQ